MFKKLRERNRDLGNRGVVLILIGIAGLSTIFSALMRGGLDNNWWADVSQGLVTEMAGAIATFWLINLIFEGRRQREQKSEAIAERKAALIRQMRSSINEEAIRAVEEMRSHGWLTDGSLHKANLMVANLQGAVLFNANLQAADFQNANLQKTNLRVANLQGANLRVANLQGADLRVANLQGANLRAANLQETNLRDSNLQGTDLEDVNLDTSTTLPDGTKWTLETDMTHFTDHEHPNFWRSDYPTTSAYRGKDT